MQLPEAFLDSLIGIKGFDKETFEKVHASGEQITSIRLNPFKVSKASEIPSLRRDLGEAVPWTGFGYYLDNRPFFTFDPLFHAGCYYVQEASSMFLEQALKQTIDLLKPIKVLDLCAAPGGKSTHMQSLISKDSLLVSNEVIRSRANVLKDNMVKWGCENVVVTNNDPKDFAGLENYFDVIVVDAPCSGSGLFRRDADAINEWSENNVQLCSQRQRRILAGVWPALKKDGILIYATCSYSKEEDEDIVKWLTENLPIVPCRLTIDDDWSIIESAGGYRFWPDRVKGEGFFLACFQKKEGEVGLAYRKKTRLDLANKGETAMIEKWIRKTNRSFIKYKNTVYAWPEQLISDFSLLLDQLHVIYSGTLLGELMRDKLVPDHSLALSNSLSDTIGRVELDFEQSIRYLRRKDPGIITKEKGWQVVTYLGHALGWLNILPNRVNNYYPRELRILKDE